MQAYAQPNNFDKARDRTHGHMMRHALKEAGYAGRPRLRFEPGRHAGYFEAHIEQGRSRKPYEPFARELQRRYVEQRLGVHFRRSQCSGRDLVIRGARLHSRERNLRRICAVSYVGSWHQVWV
jgi:hypothetical protein